MLAVVCGSTRSWPKGFAATRRAKIKIAADKEIAGDVMLNPKERNANALSIALSDDSFQVSSIRKSQRVADPSKSLDVLTIATFKPTRSGDLRSENSLGVGSLRHPTN